MDDVQAPTVTTVLWDPFGASINSDSFSTERKSLLDKLQTFKKSPFMINGLLYFFILAPLVVLAIVLFVGNTLFNNLIIHILVFGFLPLIFYYAYIKHLQNDLILYLLCQNNKWAYNPSDDGEKFKLLRTTIPSVFDVGHSQKISDQLWGRLQIQDSSDSVNFWQSTFTYTTGSGKSSHTYTRGIFAVKLNKQMPVCFTLTKEGFFSRFENDIKTESSEFNAIFHISANSKNEQTRFQIIKVLSPSVQVRLIDFMKKSSPESILFLQNCILIVFDGEGWNSEFTNFFSKLEIDKRDEALFFDYIKQVGTVPAEVIKYID